MPKELIFDLESGDLKKPEETLDGVNEEDEYDDEEEEGGDDEGT